MKKLFGIIGLIIAVFLGSGCSREQLWADRIAVCQYVHHPSLDKARKGFLEELSRLGYVEGRNVEVEYFDAKGDIDLASQIANEVAAGNYRVIFSLATPMSQLLKEKTAGTGVPIVFGAVTDPVSAGLVGSLERPGANVTGTSDRWPYYEQLTLIREVLPYVERLGVVFNPSEANTQYAMGQTRMAAERLGLLLVEMPVSSADDVYRAAEITAKQCQAFYVPADNTAMAAASTIVKVANKHKLPVVAGDPGTFEQGCLIGLGVGYYNLGVESARIVDRVINKGTSAGDIPVITSQDANLMVNVAVARRLGVVIPDEIIKKASIVTRVDPWQGATEN